MIFSVRKKLIKQTNKQHYKFFLSFFFDPYYIVTSFLSLQNNFLVFYFFCILLFLERERMSTAGGFYSSDTYSPLFKLFYLGMIDIQKAVLIQCIWFDESGDEYILMKPSLNKHVHHIQKLFPSLFICYYFLNYVYITLFVILKSLFINLKSLLNSRFYVK